MTISTFNETHFLASVKSLNEHCPARVSEQNAKDFITHILRRCDYNKEEMFHYLKSIMEEYFPEIKNRTFDVEGWKKIYNFYIKQQELYKFGELLKIGLSMAETEEHFEYGFTTAAKVAGYDGKLMLLEIRLDSIGWRKIVDTLVQVAENKGVVVPALPVAKKKKVGRKKKEMKIEDEKTVVDTPVAKEDKTPVSDAKDFVAKVDKKETSSKSKRGYRQKVVRYKDGLLVEEEPFESIMDAERRTGVNHSNITSCIKGRTKSAGGYVWKTLEEVSVSEPPVVSVEDAAVSMIETTPDTQCIEKEKLSVSNEVVGEMIVAYYLDKNKEIDRTQGPIGTFKSQKEVADRFGVSKSTISNYFRGEKESIRWTNEEGKKVKVGFVKEAA